MEVSVECACGSYLQIKESYSRFGEIVIKVEKCLTCDCDTDERVRDDAYNEGAKDGYAQCKDDLNDSLERDVENEKN